MRTAIFLLAVVGCSDRNRDGARDCTANAGCGPGEVCADGDCKAVCRSDRDCPAGSVCTGDVCAAGDRDAQPRIDTVDSNGPGDAAAGHASRHLGTHLVVTGANFLGALFTLDDGRLPMELVACELDAERAALALPPALAAGTYQLSAVNQVGSCSATLPILEGQPGAVGATGATGPTGPLPAIVAGGGLVGDGSAGSPLAVDYGLVGRRSPGSLRATAATSCGAIFGSGQHDGDGYYWIDPNGGSHDDAFQAFCDMSRDGGGWTLCFAYDTANYDSHTWPTNAEARDKLLARRWGTTRLGEVGSTQGNFCNAMAITPGSTELRAEVVTVATGAVLTSGIYRPNQADFFTQLHLHGSGQYDCLIDSTGTKRLMYANYAGSARIYNRDALLQCAGNALQHIDSAVVHPETHGVDGMLIIAGSASGESSDQHLSLHVNWLSDVGNPASLYTSAGGPDTHTKFGFAATWHYNRFGRVGASPGPTLCTTVCGYTNAATDMLKMRIFVR